MVSGRTLPSVEAPGIEFEYQARFREAACVTPGDSPDVEADKISAVWKTYGKALVCNSATFDVRDGGLLKFVVAEKFEDFLDDAIRWRLNLNNVDASDKMTLLDYVQLHVRRTTGTALESKYKYYYSMLREAGARHKAEL